MNYLVLTEEITLDPLSRGYAGMTDQEAADDLNTKYREDDVKVVSGSQILNAIDLTELNAKTDAEKAQVWNIIHIGEVNPFGVEADMLVDIFSGGSASIIALAALRKVDVSRATELGLAIVHSGTIAQARAL